MENHAEKLCLFSLKIFAFDLAFGHDKAPVHMNVSKVSFMLQWHFIARQLYSMFFFSEIHSATENFSNPWISAVK